MASLQYGYASGPRVPVLMKVDASSADIEAGDMVKVTAGYVFAISAGDIPIGVAMQKIDNPAADGGASVLVDVSGESTYWYPPDSGSATQAMVGKTMDTGGTQSLDIDASTDDVIQILEVDLSNNLLRCRLLTAGAFAGVV